jgi:hypothetical protein
MSRSLVLVLAAFFLAALVLHLPVAAQEDGPPRIGRYQISTIPGAVYMVDTATGDLFVREYQTKRWRKAGNPLSDAE